MINPLEDLMMDRFWSNWIDRFESNADKFITPDNERVLEAVEEVNFEGADTDVEKANRVWSFITHEIKWQLSKEWKKPEETLRDKIGDCEDMDFLAISMLSNVGVNDANLVIGRLIKPSGGGGAHTWVTVDGVVIDPTGTQESVEHMEYEKMHTFEIKTVIKNGS